MECNVCSQLYNVFNQKMPIVLGCGHSVCSKCLDTLLLENCPTCRSPIKSKSKNFALMEMLQRQKHETPKKGRRKDIEQLFKISIVGPSSVGKTTMLHYITKGQFNSNTIPTVGVDFTYIDKDIDGKTYRFQLWDTAGQQQYRCIAKNHYLNSDVIILTYSLNQTCSFEQVQQFWIKEIEQIAPSAKIILVGNKSDLKKMIFSQRILNLSKKYNAPSFEISCKNNIGVTTVWQSIVSYLYKNRSNKEKTIKKQKQIRISKNSQPKKGFFSKLRDCWSSFF